MSTQSREITITNLGPIDELTIKLPGPGVTVVIAPNGAGKTIALDALQGLAAGHGRLPLRDGQTRGSVDGFGIHATITPKQTRVAGEFSLTNLEGRIDGGAFVNPGVADPVAADKRRIKSLVALMDVEADGKLFSSSEHFDAEEFAFIVQQDTLASADLVDMANRIARDYQAEARQWERSAEEDTAKANSLEQQVAAIDMSAESDPEVLQALFFTAQQAYSRGAQQAKNREDKLQDAEEARAELAKWDQEEVLTVEQAREKLDDELSEVNLERVRVLDIRKQIIYLQTELGMAERNCEIVAARVEAASVTLSLAENHARRRTACFKAIADADNYAAPNDEELAGLRHAFTDAQQAMERGVRVRDAKLLVNTVALHRDSAESRKVNAERLRQCAAATDLVLCSLIDSQIFEVVTVGTNKRLVVFHPARDAKVYYHDLSEAEKWTRWVDEGVNRVGDGGLLFIRQEAWEGLDVWNRKTVHEHSVLRNVFILTIEATRHAEDGQAFHVRPFSAA